MDSIFFLISKLASPIIAPDSWLLIFIVLVWMMLWRGKTRLAKWSLGSLCILMLVMAMLPVGDWLLSPLEGRFPSNPELPGHVDGIIVLSGAENARLSVLWKQVELGDGAERDLAFLALARRFPDAKLVFTGGSGSLLDQEHREADVAKSLFAEQGLNVSRVIFERDSRNTLENAMYSKKLVKPRHDEKWLLITSAFHMPRAVGIFCKAGWPVIPYPVDHRAPPGDIFRIEFGFAGHLIQLGIGVKEWIGLVVYYVTGKTTSILPLGCV